VQGVPHSNYAALHAEHEQNRYVTHYNLRSHDKHFEVGDQVLILRPDSTSSHMFTKWTGPGTVVQVRSPYSYIVEIDGVRRHFHANHLRKFHVRVESVVCDSLSNLRLSLRLSKVVLWCMKMILILVICLLCHLR